MPTSLQAALTRAVASVANGQSAEAAALVTIMLNLAPEGDAGWQLPVDPLLDVQRDNEVWTTALVTLSGRAS